MTVPDQKSFEKIPDVPGLLSYRTDDKQLYVNQGSKWQALSTAQEVSLGSGKSGLDVIQYTVGAKKMSPNFGKILRKVYRLKNILALAT